MTTQPPHTAARDAFLARVPTNKRATTVNWFLFPIRTEGARAPDAVLTCVTAALHGRIARGYNAELAAALLTVIREQPSEALDFAAWALEWEQLPADERDAIKRDRRQEHIQGWMAERPPSEKQIAYLASLGYRGAPPTSMQAASEAIDSALAARRKGGVR